MANPVGNPVGLMQAQQYDDVSNTVHHVCRHASSAVLHVAARTIPIPGPAQDELIRVVSELGTATGEVARRVEEAWIRPFFIGEQNGQ